MFLEIPSSPEYVAIARRAVEGIARRMTFTPSQIEDLKLAFGEACANAVKYGLPTDESPNVEIKCIVLPDGLSVEISNNICDGVCLNITSEVDLSREHGRGLYMIRKLVDEVDMKWNSQVATVRLFKRVSAVAG